MITLLIISFLLVALYVGAAIWKERKLPDSVSALVWVLPKGSWRWLWTVWMWAVTFTLPPPLIETMPDDLRALGFLFGALMLFTGAFPLFDSDHVAYHNILGITAGILSQVCVVFLCPWWLLLWSVMFVLIVGSMAAFNDKEEVPKILAGKGVFLSEVICWVTLNGAILTEYLIR